LSFPQASCFIRNCADPLALDVGGGGTMQGQQKHELAGAASANTGSDEIASCCSQLRFPHVPASASNTPKPVSTSMVSSSVMGCPARK
jgi:hypothetical protein